MKETMGQTIEYWNKQAPEWIDHAIFRNYRRQLIRIARSAICDAMEGLPKIPTVLDLGRGADNAAYFDGIIAAKPFSLDISPKMLSYGSLGLEIQANAENSIPLAASSVDLCSSFYLMRYLSKSGQKRLVTEVHRILKPNGKFVIVDLVRNNYSNQKSRFHAEDLRADIEKIGFRATRAETMSGYLEDPDDRHPRNWCTGGFGASLGSDFSYGVLAGHKTELRR